MNQLIRSTLTSLVLAAVWVAGPAYAQPVSIIRVHIPFEFNVAEKTFPAGDYSVVQQFRFLSLRNARGLTIASTLTNPVESSAPPQKTTLRFYFSGGKHTLVEAWRPDAGGLGQQLSRAKSLVPVTNQPAVDDEPITGGTKP